MFNPFKFLKQNVAPDVLGIDIGTTSIKAVEVVSRGPVIGDIKYTLAVPAAAPAAVIVPVSA